MIYAALMATMRLMPRKVEIKYTVVVAVTPLSFQQHLLVRLHNIVVKVIIQRHLTAAIH